MKEKCIKRERKEILKRERKRRKYWRERKSNLRVVVFYLKKNHHYNLKAFPLFHSLSFHFSPLLDPFISLSILSLPAYFKPQEKFSFQEEEEEPKQPTVKHTLSLSFSFIFIAPHSLLSLILWYIPLPPSFSLPLSPFDSTFINSVVTCGVVLPWEFIRPEIFFQEIVWRKREERLKREETEESKEERLKKKVETSDQCEFFWNPFFKLYSLSFHSS